MQQIIDTVRAFPGVLVVRPGVGSDAPKLAWGDTFVYFSPDGETPTNTQPYATIVTKDYPDDTSSRLGDGRWRVNVRVDRDAFADVTGEDPRHLDRIRDFAKTDVLLPHPVYGPLGWVAIINPDTTLPQVINLLTAAHEAARARAQRRA
jgi:hypothetical protein